MSEIEGYIVQTSELNFFKDILKTRKTQIVKNLEKSKKRVENLCI